MDAVFQAFSPFALAQILPRLLGEYVTPASLTGQRHEWTNLGTEIQLCNLELKADVLERFRVPVIIVHGTIARLSVKLVNWNVVVSVEGVRVLLKPTARDEATLRALRASARKNALNFDALAILRALNEGKAAAASKSGYSGVVLSAILSRLRLSVADLHLRLEVDEVGPAPGEATRAPSCYAVGVIAAGATLEVNSAADLPGPLAPRDNIQGLTVYVHRPCIPSGSVGAPPLSQTLGAVPPHGAGVVIEPLHARLLVTQTLAVDSPSSSPSIEISVDASEQLRASMTAGALGAIAGMGRTLAAGFGPSTDESRGTSDDLAPLRLEYARLYRSVADADWAEARGKEAMRINSADAERLAEIEANDRLGLDLLLRLRREARDAAATAGEASMAVADAISRAAVAAVTEANDSPTFTAAKPPPSATAAPFSSARVFMTSLVHMLRTNLSPEVDYSWDGDSSGGVEAPPSAVPSSSAPAAAPPVPSTRAIPTVSEGDPGSATSADALGAWLAVRARTSVRTNVRVADVSVRLIRDDASLIAVLRAEELSLGVDTRSRGLRLSISLRDLTVTDPENVAFPCVISRELPPSATAAATLPLLSVIYDRKPVNTDDDIYAEVKLQPLTLCVVPSFALGVAAFGAVLSCLSGQRLVDSASRQAAASYVRTEIERRLRISLRLDLAAPRLVLPSDSADPSCACLAVSVGRIVLEPGESSAGTQSDSVRAAISDVGVWLREGSQDHAILGPISAGLGVTFFHAQLPRFIDVDINAEPLRVELSLKLLQCAFALSRGLRDFRSSLAGLFGAGGVGRGSEGAEGVTTVAAGRVSPGAASAVVADATIVPPVDTRVSVRCPSLMLYIPDVGAIAEGLYDSVRSTTGLPVSVHWRLAAAERWIEQVTSEGRQPGRKRGVAASFSGLAVSSLVPAFGSTTIDASLRSACIDAGLGGDLRPALSVEAGAADTGDDVLQPPSPRTTAAILSDPAVKIEASMGASETDVRARVGCVSINLQPYLVSESLALAHCASALAAAFQEAARTGEPLRTPAATPVTSSGAPRATKVSADVALLRIECQTDARVPVAVLQANGVKAGLKGGAVKASLHRVFLLDASPEAGHVFHAILWQRSDEASGRLAYPVEPAVAVSFTPATLVAPGEPVLPTRVTAALASLGILAEVDWCTRAVALALEFRDAASRAVPIFPTELQSARRPAAVSVELRAAGATLMLPDAPARIHGRILALELVAPDDSSVMRYGAVTGPVCASEARTDTPRATWEQRSSSNVEVSLGLTASFAYLIPTDVASTAPPSLRGALLPTMSSMRALVLEAPSIDIQHLTSQTVFVDCESAEVPLGAAALRRPWTVINAPRVRSTAVLACHRPVQVVSAGRDLAAAAAVLMAWSAVAGPPAQSSVVAAAPAAVVAPSVQPCPPGWDEDDYEVALAPSATPSLRLAPLLHASCQIAEPAAVPFLRVLREDARLAPAACGDGDALVSIDGVPVRDIPVAEVEAVLRGCGEARILRFRALRRVVRVEHLSADLTLVDRRRVRGLTLLSSLFPIVSPATPR